MSRVLSYIVNTIMSICFIKHAIFKSNLIRSVFQLFVILCVLVFSNAHYISYIGNDVINLLV